MNQEYQNIINIEQGPRRTIRKRYVAFISIVLFSGGFLMWDHVHYKDESPPNSIAVIRDICAILLFLSFILLVVMSSTILAKKWSESYPLLPGGNTPTTEEMLIIRILFVLLILYAASGLYWTGTYGYYTLGHHPIPDVANVFRWISMVYFIVVSVIILLYIMSKMPPELICFLFMNG